MCWKKKSYHRYESVYPPPPPPPCLTTCLSNDQDLVDFWHHDFLRCNCPHASSTHLSPDLPNNWDLMGANSELGRGRNNSHVSAPVQLLCVHLQGLLLCA